MSIPVFASPLPTFQFNQNGVPLSGGKLFTYINNTDTKLATYTDYTGATQNTNPIILDANGQCSVWLAEGQTYTFTLSPTTDTDPPTNAFWTKNGITGINDISQQQSASGPVTSGVVLMTGEIREFSGPEGAVPNGWLLCTGAAISRATYATLFDVIGTTWGAGDGSTTFNLPDKRGIVTAGADNMGGSHASRVTAASIGVAAVYGVVAGSQLSQTDTITITLIDPGHVHGITVYANVNPGGSGGSSAQLGTPGNTASATTGITASAASSLTGNQQNIQPTAFDNFIIWTGPNITAGIGSQAYTITESWTAGENPAGILLIAPDNLTITSITGRMDVLEGTSETVQPVAVANGSAVSTGTNLTSNTLNCNASLHVNQALPLVASPTLMAGQAIGLISSGAFTTCAGNITIRATSP